MEGWTYGVEHELADWDRRRPLHPRWGLDLKDVTMVNSCGVAVDPRARGFHLGGELNTPPTDQPEGQGELIAQFLQEHPDAKVNYRSNMHVHVRVPGLREDLRALKRVQRYVNNHLRELLFIVEPIPHPLNNRRPLNEKERGAMRRYRRRQVSHQTMLSPERFRRQQLAETVEEFFAAECPMSGTRPQWHLAPRCAVNLRHLREETDTVEFRHFPGTLEPHQVGSCVMWCFRFMEAALEDEPVGVLHELAHWIRQGNGFPSFRPYSHDHEVGYRMTICDGSLSEDELRRNRELVLGWKLTGENL